MATTLLPSAAVHTTSTSTATASPHSTSSYPFPPTNFLFELKGRASTPSIHSVTSFLKDPFVVVSAVAESWAYFGGRSRKRSSEEEGPSSPPSTSAVAVALDLQPIPTPAASSPSPSLALKSLLLLATSTVSSRTKAPKPSRLQTRTQKLANAVDSSIHASHSSLLSPPSASPLFSAHQNTVLTPSPPPSPIPIPVKASTPQLDVDPLSEFLFTSAPSNLVVGRGAQPRALGFSLGFAQHHYRADESTPESSEGPGSVRALVVLNKHLATLLELFNPPPAFATSPLPHPTLLSILALFATPPVGARWAEVAREVLFALEVLSRIRRQEWVKSYLRYAKDVVNERLQEEWMLLDKERVLPTRQEISLDGWRRAKVTDILVQLGLIISNEASSSLDILVFRGPFDSFPLQDLVFELCSYDASAAAGVSELVASGYNSEEVAAKLFRMARQIRAAKQNQSPSDLLLPNPKRLAQVLAPLLAKPSSTSNNTTPRSPLPDAVTSLQRDPKPTTSISFCTASSLDPNSVSFLIAPPAQLIDGPTKSKPTRRASPHTGSPPPPSLTSKPQPQPQRRGSATSSFHKSTSAPKNKPKPMRRKSSQPGVVGPVASPLPVVSSLPADGELLVPELKTSGEELELKAGPPSSSKAPSSDNLLVVGASSSPSLNPRSTTRAPTRGRTFLVSHSTRRGRASKRY